ncbi:MAG: hypothetical protein PHD61_02740 [Bacteroidales bacterium]|nr:hypothetical protein [Lentimicrobiaceae bacterium]MDD5694207.1 hypothetical protein [Bacteroidales bacterium]
MEKTITSGSTFGQDNLNTYEIIIRFSNPQKKVLRSEIDELKKRFGSIFYSFSPVQISPKLERYTELDEIGGSAIVNIVYKKSFEPIEEFEWTIIKNDSESYISKLENVLTPVVD